MTRQQFRKEFAKSLTEFCRELMRIRKAGGDKSEWRIYFEGAVLVFPESR